MLSKLNRLIVKNKKQFLANSLRKAKQSFGIKKAGLPTSRLVCKLRSVSFCNGPLQLTFGVQALQPRYAHSFEYFLSGTIAFYQRNSKGSPKNFSIEQHGLR